MTVNEKGREQAWAKMLELHPFEFTDKMLFESGWDARTASIPAVPAATKELIAEIRGRFKNRDLDWESRLIHEAADALEVLSQTPEEKWEYRGVACEPDTGDIYDSTSVAKTPEAAAQFAHDRELLAPSDGLPDLVLKIQRRRPASAWLPIEGDE